MKKLLIALMILALTIPSFAQKGKSIGKVSFSIGDNHVQSQGSMKWNKMRFFMPVQEFDKVKTSKNSRCEVTFQTKKVMRIGANSTAELTRDKEGVEEVKMSKGLAWLSIFLPKGRTKLRVRTPSSVCAIRGTVYRLKCDTVQTTYRCYKGTIQVTPFKKDGKTPSDSSFYINPGEELIVVSDFEEYKKMQEKEIKDFEQKEMDDFEKFMQKDKQDFNNMVESDLKEFKEMSDFSFKHSTFDKEKDAQSDWVKWNTERDKLISE